MAMLRRALIRFQQNPTLAVAVSPLRPQYGLLSRLSTHVGSYDFDLSNEEIKRRLFNRSSLENVGWCIAANKGAFLSWIWYWAIGLKEISDPWMSRNWVFLIDVLDLENPDLWKWRFNRSPKKSIWRPNKDRK